MSASKQGKFGTLTAFWGAALSAALVLSGCATGVPAISGDPLAALGEGAAVYAVIPVGENRELLSLLAKAIDPDSKIDAALDRTVTAYAAFFGDGNIRLLAEGSFPKAAARLAFPSSKGWKKVTVKGTGSWYRRSTIDATGTNDATGTIDARGTIDASLPGNGLACVATGNGEGMLALLANLRSPPSSPVGADFAPAGDALSSGGAIGVYVADPAPWITKILGPDVSLPVDHAVIRAIPATGEGRNREYDVSIRIETGDARTAKAMKTLLRLALQDGEPVENGTEVTVSGARFTVGELVDFTENLYF